MACALKISVRQLHASIRHVLHFMSSAPHRSRPASPSITPDALEGQFLSRHAAKTCAKRHRPMQNQRAAGDY
jgi:hypothetical protein